MQLCLARRCRREVGLAYIAKVGVEACDEGALVEEMVSSVPECEWIVPKLAIRYASLRNSSKLSTLNNFVLVGWDSLCFRRSLKTAVNCAMAWDTALETT